MARLPWTKFQDFYLRVGFLNALVALLDPHRRSVPTEILGQRLEHLLLAPARDHDDLWRAFTDRFPWAPGEFEEMERKSTRTFQGARPTLTEALLLMGRCPSQLYAMTPKTAYKILDWGRNLQLIGAGNQITEKGLVLRAMLPRDEYERFLKRDPLAWNPFVLKPRERLFFLFHLCEVDHLTLELLEYVAHARAASQAIETADALEMTCRAFFRVLNGVAGRVSSADLPTLRRARELATVMARELQLEDLVPGSGIVRERLPKPRKIKPKGALVAPKHAARRTTKNADHQTIPRFEQLVDLGFLGKPCSEVDDTEALWECRRHWRYQRLPSCDGWLVERQRTLDGQGPWEWRGFAAAALASGIAGVGRRPEDPKPEIVATFLWKGYEKVRRQVGHTPFHSIAMTAMIEAAVSGVAIEMRTFHDLVMALKKQALLQDCVYFASGNEIDRMFVVIRDGFVDGVKRVPPHLLALPR